MLNHFTACISLAAFTEYSPEPPGIPPVLTQENSYLKRSQGLSNNPCLSNKAKHVSVHYLSSPPAWTQTALHLPTVPISSQIHRPLPVPDVPREPLECHREQCLQLSLLGSASRAREPPAAPPAQRAPNPPLQLPTHAAAVRGHCRGARVWNQLLGYLQEKSNRKSALSVLQVLQP